MLACVWSAKQANRSAATTSPSRTAAAMPSPAGERGGAPGGGARGGAGWGGTGMGVAMVRESPEVRNGDRRPAYDMHAARRNI
ncbi:hypothetical protein GCM10023100_30280 [Actinocorallia cavernae]|uniref:Uncharacterized protein n=2 Tax=Actinomycetes TaxID=1760 RepID=A0ABP5YT72_9ACTN